MKEVLEKILSENKIEISNLESNMLCDFYNFLVEENNKYNLTRIISEEDVARKHFLDSISSKNFIPNTSSVVDVGAGGGFPSIPLKIVRPDLNFTLLDSVNKKVEFLQESIKLLNLKNCKAIHCRVEDFAASPEFREKYDVCVSRAVANLRTLLEYCLPLVKEGGLFIAYKGSGAEEELAESMNALKILGAQLEEIYEYKIDEDRINILLIFRKIRRTPKQYPRRNNLPRKNPL